VLLVELAVELFQPMNEPQVTGPGPLSPRTPIGQWYVGMDWKIQELSFGGAPERSWHARVEEPNDSLKDVVRSKSISPVDSEHPPVEAQHDRLIGMSEDPLDILEA
jgi:hypothetical protein